MEAVRLLEWLHFCILVWLLTASAPQFRRLQLKAGFSFLSRRDRISSSAADLQKCSRRWASCYVMMNLIIETPAPYFSFIVKMTVYSSWQQVESLCHTATECWLSTRNSIFVWSRTTTSLSLSHSACQNRCKWTQFLARCTSQINNCAHHALQYN